MTATVQHSATHFSFSKLLHLRWINSVYWRTVKVIVHVQRIHGFSKLMCLHLYMTRALPGPLEGCQWEVSEDGGGQGEGVVDTLSTLQLQACKR